MGTSRQRKQVMENTANTDAHRSSMTPQLDCLKGTIGHRGIRKTTFIFASLGLVALLITFTAFSGSSTTQRNFVNSQRNFTALPISLMVLHTRRLNMLWTGLLTCSLRPLQVEEQGPRSW